MATVDITGSNNNDLNKHFRFEGYHFKHWQQKMMFSLTMRKVVYVLNTDIPVIPEDAEKEVKDKMTMELALWNENDLFDIMDDWLAIRVTFQVIFSVGC